MSGRAVTTDATDIADRGTLTINPSVVRKVAQHAADSAPGAVRSARRIAGLGWGEHGANVRVSGNSDHVDLAVDIALRYPAPIRQVVAALRTEVAAEVERITAHRVRTCDVTVSALLPETRDRVR